MNTESDQSEGVVVSFEGLTGAEANRAVLELREMIDGRGQDVTATVRKTEPGTQDIGQTLVLLFGTGAAIAIAEGIKAYLAKRGSKVVIKTRAGEIVATGDALKKMDVAAATKALALHARKSR